MRRSALILAAAVAICGPALCHDSPEPARGEEIPAIRNPQSAFRNGLWAQPVAGGPAAARPATQPLAGPATQPAKAQPLRIVERSIAPGGVVVARLDNNLTVIVKATRTAPVVCVRALVRAGGIYEGKYLGCGVSHVVEHLVAKGDVEQDGPEGSAMTQTRAIVSEIGGQSNASTSMASTQYYISAAAGKAMDCIDLIAGWMARAQIDEADFRREQGVVLRELELGKDDPDRQMWEAHSAAVFGTHPAAVPIIGYAEPLGKLTVEDVRAYRQRMYSPGNMVFVIVGDVDVEKALARACAAFAGFAATRVPELSLPAVQPLAGVVRSAGPHAELKEAMEELSFQTIPLLHEDLHALDVLATVLGAGEASRLVAKVRRELNLVTQVSCSSWTPNWGMGIFNVSFRSEPDKADEAEKAILQVLQEAAEKPVTEEELARAKRQMVAQYVHSQQSVESISSDLGTDFLTTGDATFSRGYTQRIEAVTAEQVHRAARKYLTFDKMAITRLVPGDRFAAVGTAAEQAGKSAARMLALPNGLRVVLSSTDAVGLVSMAFVTKGGLMVEDESTSGMGSLMAALCTKGAGDLPAEQIAQFFAKAGGSISGGCGNNSFHWQASALDDSFPKALEIYAKVITAPTLPAKELELLKTQQLAAIDRIGEEWFDELQQFCRGRFFAGSPYAMLPVGRKEAVQAATVEQIAAYRRKHIVAGDSVLAIFGHFDAAAAEKRIGDLFADLPAGKVKLAIPPPPKVPPAGDLSILKTPKKIAAVLVAVPGMTMENLDDRFAMDVLDTILSGYRLPDGWLHSELRGKQLVYVVHAYNWPGLAPGAFVVYAAGQPDKAPEVIRIIEKDLRRAATYAPTDAEVRRAVNTILTAELLGNQSMSALAMGAALDELYGFGWDFRGKLEGLYNKITPADVTRVGKKYLSGGYAVFVTTPAPELIDKPPKDAPATQP